MHERGDPDDRTYTVVVNDEEQYSIWLDGRPLPAGWRSTGVTGGKERCLDEIERIWTDIRPLSLRRWMREHAASGSGD